MQRYIFEPGASILYAPGASPRLKPLPITAGMVLRQFGPRVAIMTAAGRRLVMASNIVYTGYCAQCERPAVERDEVLICPSCEQPACQEQPPEYLYTLWQFGNWSRVIYECVLHPDSTINEAIERLKARERTYVLPSTPAQLPEPSEGTYILHEILDELPAEQAKWLTFMLASCDFLKPQILDLIAPLCSVPVVLNALVHAALKQDRFRFAEIAAVALAVSRACFDALEPPGGIPPGRQRPADDKTPDGADDLTRWLEAQFTRKAA